MADDRVDFIEAYDGAMSSELCAKLISKFELSSDLHKQGETGAGVNRSMKDSTDLSIPEAGEWQGLRTEILDVTLQHLLKYTTKYNSLIYGGVTFTIPDPSTGDAMMITEQTIKRLSDMEIGNLMLRLYRPGQLNIQKYNAGTGGYHHWHSEIYPRDTNCETLHRVLLFMFYLNDVAEGGETEFLYQNRSISARAGTMVIAPAGFTHTHRGNLARSGDKYILTSWVMFQPAGLVYSNSRNS